MTENEYVDIGNLRDSVRRIEARIGKKVIGSERIVRLQPYVKPVKPTIRILPFKCTSQWTDRNRHQFAGIIRQHQRWIELHCVPLRAAKWHV